MFKKEIEIIFSIIKEELSLGKEIVISKNRKQEIVDARRIFSLICKKNSKLSLSVIGENLGIKNHGSISNLIKSHNNLYEKDKVYASKFDRVNVKFLTNKLISNKIIDSIEQAKIRNNSLLKSIEKEIDSLRSENKEIDKKEFNVGLFFGDFNPIHNGHLIMANNCLHQFNFDEVWFVVSSEKRYPKDFEILPLKDRFNLIKKSIANNPFFKVSDIENKIENICSINETLEAFRKKYPKHNFSVIINHDDLKNFHKIKDYESIMMYHKILYFEHFSSVGLAAVHLGIAKFYNAELIEQNFSIGIYSKKIREVIKEGESIQKLRYLVPDECLYLIEKNEFYKKELIKNNYI
jgi:nicotinate-nucleotide adenylyltransferase